MEQTYRVGTRASPLALKQAEEAVNALIRFYPEVKIETAAIDTYGDRDKNTLISEIEGSDFFTREIDEALLKGEIDFAVHSAKDLPLTHSLSPIGRGLRRGGKFKEGLVIAALTKSIDPHDVLVSKSGLKLDGLPFGAKIGTSSLRRKQQLKKYRNDFQIVDIRGSIGERLRLLDNDGSRIASHQSRNLSAIVIAAAGLMRLGLEGRITQRIPLEILRPHPLQGSLAVVARKGDLNLIKLLSVIDQKSPQSSRGARLFCSARNDGVGKVYLVGAGPGSPDLITVRGFNVLKEADVVIYDYLVDKKILEEAREGAELICCDKLAKKERYSDGFLKFPSPSPQRGEGRSEGANLLIKKAKEGKKVIRLKNGDPSIFSRGSQELDALVKERVEFEVVPGVTAASAASCFSGIPLTDRRFASSCIFVTGHEDPNKDESLIDWCSIAKSGTVALYMAVENLEIIVKQMLKAGKDKNTAVAIVQDASLVTQKVLTGTLKDIVAKAKRERLRPPAIVIIGKTAELEKEFNWVKKNKRILFTGLSKERFFIKGTYFHLPLIKIEPIEDYREFDNYLKNITEFDWIVFASRYGVEYFFKRLKYVGFDSRILNNIKVAAIGNSTRNRLLDFGILADLVPKKESSEGLIEEFQKLNIKGKKIFLPRSDISDKGLSRALEGLGAKITTSFAYRNVEPCDLPDLDLNFFDEVVFTSPSTVRNFKKRYKDVPKNVKLRCIGDVTQKEAKRCRLSG